jgi:hypothetical protein
LKGFQELVPVMAIMLLAFFANVGGAQRSKHLSKSRQRLATRACCRRQGLGPSRHWRARVIVLIKYRRKIGTV